MVKPSAVPGPAGAPARRVLTDDAYEMLLALLLDGEAEPGSPLRIDALARSWHVSPTPVREALARAEGTGMVVRVPLRGYVAAPALSVAEFGDLMAVRLLLEPPAARSAAARISAEDLAALQAHVATMRTAPTGPGYREFRDYLRADAAFHDVVTAASGNRFLTAALGPLEVHVQRFRRFSPAGVTDAGEAVAEHERVLAALRRGDGPGAEQAMRRHLRGVHARATTT